MGTTQTTYGRLDESVHLRKALGEALKDRRNELGLRQREIATTMGWSYYTVVSQMEAGKMRLPPESLQALADILQFNPRDLAHATWVAYDPVTWELSDGRKPTPALIRTILGLGATGNNSTTRRRG